jgi:hypothetical protein
MNPDLADTIALLTRTPAALNALLRDLPESWTHRNEGELTWSPYEVIGHLIHGEHTDWIPKTDRRSGKICCQLGERVPHPSRLFSLGREFAGYKLARTGGLRKSDFFPRKTSRLLFARSPTIALTFATSSSGSSDKLRTPSATSLISKSRPLTFPSGTISSVWSVVR